MKAATDTGPEPWEDALAAADIGAWKLDLVDHTAWRSLRHDQIFGYRELLPEWTYEQFLEHVVEADKARVNEAFELALEGRTDWSFQCRIRRIDGEQRWIWAKGRARYDAAGQPTQMWGIVQDITKPKLAEAALREADRRKDEFLAMLGHELRNPLAGLAMAMKLLERPDLDPERRQQMQQVSERQLTTLSRLVDDLLDVSRITRGVIELRQSRVDLGEVVQRALETALPQLEEKHHRVEVGAAGDGPLPVHGDPVRLEQVVTNLLTNAGKYTEPGGHIRIDLQRRGERAELRVRDDGMGIDAELLPNIFNLFRQGQRRLDRAQGGLGLGLTISKHLVELHGGRIAAYSDGPGRGAEFVVTLPLTAAEAALAGAPRPAAADPSHSKRVLVVDDNLDAAQSLATLLQLAGHSVTLAHDGPSALAKAARTHPELVFLDIGLPGMDGHEVARRLRQDPRTRDIALAAVTGYGQASDRAQSRAAGFDEHFVKPLDLEALERFVAAL